MTNLKLLLLFQLISFILYGNTLTGEFVYDDNFFTNRPELYQLNHIPKLFLEPLLPEHRTSGLYRPLSVASFSLNFILFGKDPLSFHLINIILNGLVCFFVYKVTNALFKNSSLAIFTSVFYAFLPIHTEAVAYIKARDEILATLFCLISWYNFQKSRFKTSSIFYLLSLLSKDMFIVAPAIFMVTHLYQHKFSLRQIVSPALLFLTTALPYMLLRVGVLGSAAFGLDDISYATNPLKDADKLTSTFTAFKILTIYIQKTLLPINLSATYHLNHLVPINNFSTFISSPQAILGLITLVFMVTLLFIKTLRTTPIPIGIISFLLSYILISQFLINAGDIVGERWAYFPTFGLSLIVGFILQLAHSRHPKPTITCFIVIVFWFSAITINRNTIWHSNSTLFNSMIKDAPKSIQGYVGLGREKLASKNLNEAALLAQKGIDIFPDHAPLINLLAGVSLQKGDYQKAEELFVQSYQIDPLLGETNSALGAIRFSQGKYLEALGFFENLMLNSSPTHPKPNYVILYAATLNRLGRYSDSQKILDRYLHLLPQNPQVKELIQKNNEHLR